MNALTLGHTTLMENAVPVRQGRPERCSDNRQAGMSEADREFEARLRWFLAVSRNA